MDRIADRLRLPTPIAGKVPEVTIAFWVAKIMTTGMGEDTSDFFVHSIGPIVSVMAGFAAFVFALWLQLHARSYRAWVYWFAIVMVSVFGTMAADVVHIGLGVPYVASSSFFLLALIGIFVVWHRVEGTLSIDSITTRRRELFYWATILTTFALGTAAGDMTAHTLAWGFAWSGVLFGVLFFVPGLVYLVVRLDAVLAFWISYVITRPFGASFADWFGAQRRLGGLGFGFGTVAIVLSVAIIGMVRVLQMQDVSRLRLQKVSA